MSEFDIVVKYKPGSAMIKPDELSCKTGNAKEGLESPFCPDGTILGLDHVDRDIDIARDINSQTWICQMLILVLILAPGNARKRDS